jgi:hypothetical protein
MKGGFFLTRDIWHLTSPAATLMICGVKFAPDAQATNSPVINGKITRSEYDGR